MALTPIDTSLAALAPSIAGGVLIGLAAGLFLLANGRIAGISGILHGTLFGPRVAARTWFIAGLLGVAIAASALGFFKAAALVPQPAWPKLIGAGLLVGYGTRLGNGCTSGHGLCGMAAGSGRGLLATAIFMAIAAAVVRLGFGGLA